MILFTVHLIANASTDQEWLNLLHFKEHATIVDTPEFFIDPNGSTSSQKELDASITATRSVKRYGKLKLPFACSYPARFKYLVKKYGVSKKIDCPELDSWLEGINADSLSLVFASYYPNNPASIFGHTFLKINTSSKNLISDYAVNYLAVTSETNGLMFGLKGLFGFYRGQLSILPYFMKVNEYNHSESRDIYEYHLNFNKDEVDTLLRHVWELENNGAFDYYFLDDNCSYFLLRLLDVARPSLKLSQNFPYIVIPAETIKAVHQKGITTKIDYRPSLYSLVDQNLKEKGINDLDNQILIHQFKKQTEKKSDKKSNQEYHDLLVKRSKLLNSIPSNDYKPLSYPHETHSPVATGIGLGILNQKYFTKFSIRPGVHSFFDSSSGYLPNSSIEMFKFSFRLLNMNQLYLDQVTLIDVQTLNPHRSWNSKLSWKSKIEYSKFDQDTCLNCDGVRLFTAIGKSFEFRQNNLLSLFLDGQFLWSDELSKKLSYGLSPTLSFNQTTTLLGAETSASLINRFDQKQIIDSLKFSQVLSVHLNKSHQLRIQGRYYAPISQSSDNRSEGLLEWFMFH